jgi:MFS family permease
VVGFVAAGTGLIEKMGRRLLMLGMIVMMAGTVCFAATIWLAGADINPYRLIPGLFLVGAGMGLAMAPFFNIVLAGVDDEETGSASGALTSVQQLGGAFGIAVLGTIFFALLPGQVAGHVDHSTAELRTVLTASGVPADTQQAIAAGLRDCLRDRTAEDDPDVVPPSCADGPHSPQVAAYAQEQVRAGFQDATIRTTGVTLALLILVFGLAFLLPKHARPGG